MTTDPKTFAATYRKPGQFAGDTPKARQSGPAITAVTQRNSDPETYLGGLQDVWEG